MVLPQGIPNERTVNMVDTLNIRSNNTLPEHLHSTIL